jgi:hypothetical protein
MRLRTDNVWEKAQAAISTEQTLGSHLRFYKNEIVCKQKNLRRYTLIIRYGKSEVFAVRPGRDAK